MKKQLNHWAGHAAKWSHVGSPLRPNPQDIAVFCDVLQNQCKNLLISQKSRILLLGVTPELALMNYPRGSHLIAVDNSQAMIRDVWPASLVTNATAICADWRHLPLAPGSCDLVLADGCFTLLSFPGEYHKVLSSLHQVLAQDSYLAVRFFVRPDKAETINDILKDLKDNRVTSFHALKWRIGMSIQGENSKIGVRLGDIWDVWKKMFEKDVINPNNLQWTHQTISTIDNYRGVGARYSFPSYAELSARFSHYFSEVSRFQGNYELANCCPIILFKVKSNI